MIWSAAAVWECHRRNSGVTIQQQTLISRCCHLCRKCARARFDTDSVRSFQAHPENRIGQWGSGEMWSYFFQLRQNIKEHPSLRVCSWCWERRPGWPAGWTSWRQRICIWLKAWRGGQSPAQQTLSGCAHPAHPVGAAVEHLPSLCTIFTVYSFSKLNCFELHQLCGKYISHNNKHWQQQYPWCLGCLPMVLCSRSCLPLV